MSDELAAGAAATTTTTTETGAQAAPASVSGAQGGAAAAAPAQTAQSSGTLLGGDAGAAGGQEKTVAQTWPDDWRQKLAGDDAAFGKRLERFASPADIAKSYRELEARVSSGQVKKALGDNPTAEELSAFRKENGIPESAEAYDIKPTTGVVFGEADKPVIDALKAHAHANNWSPEQANKVADLYAAVQEQTAARQAEADLATKTASEDALRAEWGAEFRPNINAVKNLLAAAPDGLADRLMGARLSDGTMLGNDAKAVAWLANLSREMNPAASVVPAGTQNAPKAIGDEITSIKAMMADHSSDYWKGPKSDALQARYRELVSAQEKLRARG